MQDLPPIPSAASDSWTVSEGSYAGQPTQIRHRSGLAAYVGHPDYPRRLTITWEYEAAEEFGALPSPQLLEQMHAFEEKLSDAFDENRDGIIAFIFTCNGTREWHFYIQDVEVIGDILNRTLETGLPISIEVEDDAEWSEFSDVLSMVSDR